jgi:STE24 endopeptidase
VGLGISSDDRLCDHRDRHRACFIMPLFNKFTPIGNAELRQHLKMAHDNGIPANEVYEMDASKRTDRISAFVNGLLGTMRIVMFDNTLRRCTPAEIRMIMGHEMGHYVLNHVWKGVAFFGALIVLGFCSCAGPSRGR